MYKRGYNRVAFDDRLPWLQGGLVGRGAETSGSDPTKCTNGEGPRSNKGVSVEEIGDFDDRASGTNPKRWFSDQRGCSCQGQPKDKFPTSTMRQHRYHIVDPAPRFRDRERSRRIAPRVHASVFRVLTR